MNVITPAEMVGRKHMISAGVLPEVADQTLVLTFNSLEEVEAAARLHRGELAAVIMELIPHNVGAILPDHDFIKGVREVCDREGIVLIFDEVITGFRHGLSGYQGHCKVSPDVTTVGKSMANGYPISGILGREDLMERYAPAGGDVFLSGTFYGHPLVCAASLATVRELERPRLLRPAVLARREGEARAHPHGGGAEGSGLHNGLRLCVHHLLYGPAGAQLFGPAAERQARLRRIPEAHGLQRALSPPPEPEEGLCLRFAHRRGGRLDAGGHRGGLVGAQE